MFILPPFDLNEAIQPIYSAWKPSLKCTAPPVEKARFLELDCSVGANIIPVAAHYPNAQCLGLDFSETEIAIGANQRSCFEQDRITTSIHFKLRKNY